MWTLLTFSANESAPLDDMPSWAREIGFSRARHDILERVALLRRIPISPGDVEGVVGAAALMPGIFLLYIARWPLCSSGAFQYLIV